MSHDFEDYVQIRPTWGSYKDPSKQEPYPPFVALRDSGWLREEIIEDELRRWYTQRWEAPAWVAMPFAQQLAITDVEHATVVLLRVKTDVVFAGALHHLYELGEYAAMLELADYPPGGGSLR